MPSRKLSLAAAGAALAGLALAAGVGVASAPAAGASVTRASATPNAVVLYFHLNNLKSDLCTSVAGRNAVQAHCIFDPNPSHPQVPPYQAWGFPSAGGGYVLAENLNRQCLGIAGSSRSAGARVIVEACRKQAPEEWRVKVLKNTFPFIYEFINRNSGLCLDIASASTRPGAPLVQERYAGRSDQKWFQDNTIN
jgi:hypothetical protein